MLREVAMSGLRPNTPAGCNIVLLRLKSPQDAEEGELCRNTTHCERKSCTEGELCSNTTRRLLARGTERLQAFDMLCAHMFQAFASIRVFPQLLFARAHLIVGALFAMK